MFALLCLILSSLLLAEAWLAPAHSNRRRAVLAGLGVAVGLLFIWQLLRQGTLPPILARFVMPAGMLWLVGIGAIAYTFAQRQRRACLFVTLCWVLYTLTGSTFVGHTLLKSSEQRYASIDPFGEHYDIVHVLGGGTHQYDNYQQLAFSGDRVALGARLWHSGNTPQLLTTGSTPGAAKNQHNSAQVTANIWEQMGVDGDKIMKVPRPTNTREEMQTLKALQEEYGWERIGVVSSARHLPRVERNAERAGVEIEPIPADFLSNPTAVFPAFVSLVPSSVGFFTVHAACWEWLARRAGR